MSWRVGNVEVFRLHDLIDQPIDPAEFFPGLTLGSEPAWYLEPPFFDPDRARLMFNVQSYLVRCEHGVFLIDACVGAGKNRTRHHFDHLGDRWIRSLERSGHSREDISAIVLTHLHVDHVGWCTSWDGSGWTPTFPNVPVLVSEEDLEFWQGPAGRPGLERTGDYIEDSVRPLIGAGLLQPIAPPRRLCPDLEIVSAPGHSPGHVAVEVCSEGDYGVFSGDLMHHPAQLAHDSVASRYCTDPSAAVTTRRRLLDDYAAANALIFTAHFAGSGAGRLRKAGPSLRFELEAETVGDQDPARASDV